MNLLEEKEIIRNEKLIFVIFLIILLCGCEKKDFSIICESEYPVDGKENFSYIISNNSDEAIEELTPGKYRLEKEIAFNWYYVEFEIC